MTQRVATPRTGLKRGVSELNTIARASLSSAAATVADGAAYQLLLLSVTHSYTVAAFAGAVLGGLTNFTINRRWTFRSTNKRLRKQAAEYAIASLATYVALQSCLFVFIEALAIDEHAAWIPAKIIAWLFVSYPMQRFLVFPSDPVRVSVPGQSPDTCP